MHGTVLVAERDPFLRRSLVRFLTTVGYRAESFDGAPTAHQVTGARLLIVDDGLLSTLPLELRHLPRVVLASGPQDPGELGIWLQKPCLGEDLVWALREALRQVS